MVYQSYNTQFYIITVATERHAVKVASLEMQVQKLQKEKKDLKQGVLLFILYKDKNISNDGGVSRQTELKRKK